MKLSGRLYYTDKGWLIKPDRALTPSELERLDTLAPDPSKGASVQLEFIDPRKANAKQRRLFFALISDIHRWSGEPSDWLKEYFYLKFVIAHDGKLISLADDTKNTVTDATQLIDLLTDFIIDWEVPVEDGYELLPRDEEHFIYECLIHRKCVICGRRADLHHVDRGMGNNTVGMGVNRNKVDHSKRELYPLCRVHHTEIEKLNTRLFEQKHHIHVKGIKLTPEILRKLGVRGNYDNLEAN